MEAGLSLSDALARHPDVFNELYVAMVAAGESGGMLESAPGPHRRPAREGRLALRRQVRSTMVYPSLIAGFAGLVLIALGRS